MKQQWQDDGASEGDKSTEAKPVREGLFRDRLKPPVYQGFAHKWREVHTEDLLPPFYARKVASEIVSHLNDNQLPGTCKENQFVKADGKYIPSLFRRR